MLVLSEKELVGQKDAQTVQLGEKRSAREHEGAQGWSQGCREDRRVRGGRSALE